MSFTSDHNLKFVKLDEYLRNPSQIKREANGGNCILFCYPPEEEKLYLEKAQKKYSEIAEFINVNSLLVKFIDKTGWEEFSIHYNNFRDTPHVVFRPDDKSISLLEMIISSIQDVILKNKIPILVRSGCLYDTEIDNINIAQHEHVMNLGQPLIVFYPSTGSDRRIKFLNSRLTNSYRCAVVF